MKYIFFKRRILAMLLPMMALTIATSCGKDDVIEPNNGNSINNGGDNNQQDQEIVVTVDANGKADGGHQFSRIDETNFYIDDIKYTAKDGYLVVSGYDPVFFKGEAKIISKLVYHDTSLKAIGIIDGAFKGCANLTSVIIPESVINICMGAFSACRVLTDFYCYAKNPPTIELVAVYYWAWGGDPSLRLISPDDELYIKEHTTLHVPAGSVEKYKGTEPWSSFKDIVAIPNN